MRVRRGILALSVGSMVLLGLAASQSRAAVGIYYAQGKVDSCWNDDPSLDPYGVLTPPEDHFGGTGVSSAYLTGTWGFGAPANPQVSTIEGPIYADPSYSNEEWGATIAQGTGSLYAGVTPAGFQLNGFGRAHVKYDSGSILSTVLANGNAYFTTNFDVSPESNYMLTLTGTAVADPNTTLTIRLAEGDANGNPIGSSTINVSGSESINNDFLLKAGNLYVFEVYADAGMPQADGQNPEIDRIASFDLVGTFAAVPEPMGISMGILGAALSLLRRRTSASRK